VPLHLAFGLSIVVAVTGWRLRALTPTGAATAVLVGTAILGTTGWAGFAALAAFFAGGSAISRLAPDLAAQRFDAKGTERDAWQVLANGGPAALGALLELAVPGAGLWLVTASLAAASADTWATATGAWSRTPPRHIVSGAPLQPGASGGVTWLGTLGALVGAGLVAAAALAGGAPGPLFPLAVGVGMLGMLVDSLLGATLQGRFTCPACGSATERPVHRCGSRTVLTGGLRWLGNDAVNAAAAGIGAVGGLLGWMGLG